MARTSTRANPDSDLVGKHVRTLPRRFRQNAANSLSAEWELRVGQEVFAISIADHACFVREGPSVAPSTVIVTDPETWLDIDEGRTTGGEAFLSRRLAMSGNVDLAVRLQTLFRPYRRARRASDMDQIEVDAGGIRLSSYMVGSGPPVVLIHGLGATKITWLPLIPSLAERYRVIVPDLPGHGESEKPKTDYTPRFFARTLRHLMDELEVDTAPILGNSLGGRIALELALRSPNRVESLTLLDPSVPGMRWRYILGFTRVIPTELGAIPFPMRERMTRVILRRLFGDPARLTDDAYSVAAKEFMRIYADPRARVAFFSALRHIITERPEAFYGSLRRIKQPTLVIFGDNDRLVPLRLGIRLSEHLPNCELVVLPGVGHVPQFEATDETADAVGTFLASL